MRPIRTSHKRVCRVPSREVLPTPLVASFLSKSRRPLERASSEIYATMFNHDRHWARQIWDSYLAHSTDMDSVWCGERYTETYRKIRIDLIHETSADTVQLDVDLNERSVAVRAWREIEGDATWELTPSVFEDVSKALADMGIDPPTAQAVPADYQRLARRTWDRAFCRPRNNLWSLYLYSEVPESACVTWSNLGPKKITLSFESSATVRLSYREDPCDSGLNDFESIWVDACGSEISPEVRLGVNKRLAKLGIAGFLL